MRFARGGRVLFVATSHAGLVGTITAAAAGFGVSVNHRSGEDVRSGKAERRQAQLARVQEGARSGRAPISLLVRHVAETAASR